MHIDQQKSLKHDHISVCICTYKRPNLLATLLNKLQNQITHHLFTFSVVIVDNDCRHSAKSTVESIKQKTSIRIDYYNESEQNIALARNKAVQNSKGNIVAFIDDDEFPVDQWLLNLYRAYKESKADGVLGPVNPQFQIEPPQWIIKGKLLERESLMTGSIVKNLKYMRTGNVLLAKEIINEKEGPFDPRFGRTGGEDADFFKRMISRGHTFVWCDEACVYETVLPDRLKRVYFLKRAFLRGMGSVRIKSFTILGMLKSLVAFTLYTSALPVFFVLGNHLFMKYLIKDCDHIGKLLAFCGIEIVKERDF
ncbi:MAG: glycosyltransferase family 2 protein [Candidatus Hodarchaeota archaeon]